MTGFFLFNDLDGLLINIKDCITKLLEPDITQWLLIKWLVLSKPTLKKSKWMHVFS